MECKSDLGEWQGDVLVIAKSYPVYAKENGLLHLPGWHGLPDWRNARIKSWQSCNHSAPVQFTNLAFNYLEGTRMR